MPTVMAVSGAIQMQVMLGQTTEKGDLDSGAEANGLLASSILAIRTVSAFSMQDALQASYEKVSHRQLDLSAQVSNWRMLHAVAGPATGVIRTEGPWFHSRQYRRDYQPYHLRHLGYGHE
jgi:hypothetical protein